MEVLEIKSAQALHERALQEGTSCIQAPKPFNAHIFAGSSKELLCSVVERISGASFKKNDTAAGELCQRGRKVEAHCS